MQNLFLFPRAAETSPANQWVGPPSRRWPCLFQFDPAAEIALGFVTVGSSSSRPLPALAIAFLFSAGTLSFHIDRHRPEGGLLPSRFDSSSSPEGKLCVSFYKESKNPPPPFSPRRPRAICSFALSRTVMAPPSDQFAFVPPKEPK